MTSAALADTLEGVPESFFAGRAFLEHWHDFFLMAGTAAVTLAGLLFIALSLHMELLVQDQHRGALAVARSALTSFVYVMVLAFLMLAPAVGGRPTGVTLMVMAVMFTILMLIEMRGALRHEHAEFTRRTVRRRLMLPIVGAGFMAIAGYALFRRHPESFYAIVSAVIMLLVNAAYASWDLLVRVSKVRARTKLP